MPLCPVHPSAHLPPRGVITNKIKKLFLCFWPANDCLISSPRATGDCNERMECCSKEQNAADYIYIYIYIKAVEKGRKWT